RHVFDDIPHLVLVFRSTGSQNEFPLAEAQLFDLIGSLVLHQIMRLLSGCGRNIFGDLFSPLRWRCRSSLCRRQSVVCPTLVGAVIVLVNLFSIGLDLVLSWASRCEAGGSRNIEQAV